MCLSLPPWDLNLILSVLQKPQFENISELPLLKLCQNLAFLVAIISAGRVSKLAALSCKSPLMVLHKDNVVLSPHPFHLHDDIVLPSLCPRPSHRKGVALHLVAVVWGIRLYMSATAPFLEVGVHFCDCGCSIKGSGGRFWLLFCIGSDKRLSRLMPLGSGASLSHHGILSGRFCAFRAFRNQASLSQVCKARVVCAHISQVFFCTAWCLTELSMVWGVRVVVVTASCDCP